MKKTLLATSMAFALLFSFSASASSNPMEGRWHCWHDEFEGFKATKFDADAVHTGGGGYIFRAIEIGYENSYGEPRYTGEIQASINGMSITLNIPYPYSQRIRSATVDLLSKFKPGLGFSSGNFDYKINGVLNATSRQVVDVTIPSVNGPIVIPQMVENEVPVMFSCWKQNPNQ